MTSAPLFPTARGKRRKIVMNWLVGSLATSRYAQLCDVGLRDGGRSVRFSPAI